MNKIFHCTDGCLAPIIGKKKYNNKWCLYEISKVLGMGSAEYNNQVTCEEYDELVALNSLSGVSYIATRIDDNWGLIELKYNSQTHKYEWDMLAFNMYNDLDELLSNFDINKDEFQII